MADIISDKGKYLSSDGKTQIAYYIFAPEKPRAVIQLLHGMNEYVERYLPHIEYFVSQGFAFCGNDHLGHGNTATDANELGYTGSADNLIEDAALMTDIIRDKFPNLPVILLGHSMGSFIARCYITKYGDKITAAVLSGTAGPGNPTGLGKLLSSLSAKRHGDHYRDVFIKNISTGSYNKKFGKDAPASSWVTSNLEVMKKYDADPLCNYIFTVNGYYNLFDLLGRISTGSWAGNVPQNLPILLISGENDPVGGFCKGVNKVYNRLRSAGVKDVTVRFIKNARHEPLNEYEETRNETYKTITDWINERIK